MVISSLSRLFSPLVSDQGLAWDTRVPVRDFLFPVTSRTFRPFTTFRFLLLSQRPTSDYVNKISLNPLIKINKSVPLGNSCLGPNINPTTCLQLDPAKGRLRVRACVRAPLFLFACASLSVLSVYEGCYFRCNLFQPS